MADSALKIARCENSTISQAWCILEGMPSAVNDDEILLLGANINKHFPPDHQKTRVTIRSNKTNAILSPIWIFEVKLNESVKLRFGHQHISAHFVTDRQPSDYISFKESVYPELCKAILFARDFSPDYLGKMIIGKVGMGYTNKFRFSSENFEIPKYFNCSISFDVGNHVDTVSNISFEAKLFHNSTNRNTRLRFEANVIPPTSADLEVKTHVFSYARPLGQVELSQNDKIEALAFDIKDFSKQTFFNFCTEITKRDILKAQES